MVFCDSLGKCALECRDLLEGHTAGQSGLNRYLLPAITKQPREISAWIPIHRPAASQSKEFFAGVRTAVAEEIDKYEDDIEKLIDTGKEKGYLTYGEVNDLLPGDITTPDDLDDLLTTINTQGIDVLSGESKLEATATSMSPRPAKSPTT